MDVDMKNKDDMEEKRERERDRDRDYDRSGRDRDGDRDRDRDRDRRGSRRSGRDDHWEPDRRNGSDRDVSVASLLFFFFFSALMWMLMNQTLQRRRRSRSPSRTRRRSSSPRRRSRRSRSRTRSHTHSRSRSRSKDRKVDAFSRSLGGPVNAPHEEAVEFAKQSKRENRVYVGNLSYDVKYRDLIEFMRGGGCGGISCSFSVSVLFRKRAGARCSIAYVRRRAGVLHREARLGTSLSTQRAAASRSMTWR